MLNFTSVDTESSFMNYNKRYVYIYYYTVFITQTYQCVMCDTLYYNMRAELILH